MKSGRRTLHWDTPMPAHVQRHHEHPDTSDGLHMLHRIARGPAGPDGIKAGDFNLRDFWSRRHRRYVTAGAHWPDPVRNGYTRMRRWHGIGTRPMTHAELHRREWTWEQVRRWRRPNGERVLPYGRLLHWGALLGVVVVGERKNVHPSSAAAMVAEARRHDHPAWTMVLDTMAPRQWVAAYKDADGQVALICGRDGLQVPRSWPEWSSHPDQLWVPPAARRRLERLAPPTAYQRSAR
jgi:hypothetical protein